MVFVSYSRSEAPFVEALTAELEDQGIGVWLDYRDLNPGEDWDAQLARGIDDADAVLLVVSRRSIASEHVGKELERALNSQRRVVLALVEAVPLPEQLRHCSWVDMRGGLPTAVSRLAGALRGDGGGEHSSPRPESGFRAPLAVWMAAALAVPVALVSLTAWWTVVIPFVLVPLPFRLLRREFNYAAVRTSLIALPWTASVLTFFAEDIGEDSFAFALAESFVGWSVVLGLGLYLALRSRRVRRWMKPVAARPFAPSRAAIKREPVPSTFAIDFAPEDVGYARPLERVLLAQQHEKTDPAAAAVTLRLISRFNDTEEIPADQLVLPVLIQDPDDELPERLKRTQWIDLRRGTRRYEMRSIARSLDDPAGLLRSIGIPPPHDQLVMPTGVFALYLGLWAAVLAPLSALWFVVYAQVRYDPDFYLAGPVAFVVLAVIVVRASWWAKSAVLERRPGVPLRRLVAAVAFGLLGLLLMTRSADPPDDLGNSLVDAAAVALLVPIICMPLSWAVYGNSIDRWIPTRAQGPAPELPNWRSRSLRLLAVAFACTVWVLGYFL